MTLLLFCFLLGCVAGLRSLTAPAVVCWAAHLGWLNLAGSKLAFMGHPGALGLCGIALAISAGGSLIVAAVVGVAGALVGTFAGYNIRHALVARVRLPDLAVALVEDLVAIAGGFLIVSRL
jgi:uncharacterized membrane protein